MANAQHRHRNQGTGGWADALDGYFENGRVDEGDLATVLDKITRQWVGHHGAGRSVAVSAETNEHVALLNDSIQRARGDHGQLGPVAARIADGATAAAGDIVVTRRNDRTLTTDQASPSATGNAGPSPSSTTTAR